MFDRVSIFCCSWGLLLLVLILTGISTADTNKVYFRGDKDYPPYEFNNEEGLAEGFNVEILKAVCRSMDIDVTIELGTWSEVRTQLENGEIDGITGMYNTPQRDSLVDFTKPHFVSSYSIFVRKNSDIKGLEDIKDKIILVQNGDVAHDFVIEEGYGERILTESSAEEAIIGVYEGRADCAIQNRIQGTLLLKKLNLDDKIKIVGKPFLQRNYCIAVKEGDSELREKLNEGLILIRTSGEYDKIYDKWFGEDIDNPMSFLDVLRIVGWLLAILILAALVSIIWSISLKRRVSTKTEDYKKELKNRKRVEERLRMIAEITMDLIYEKNLETNEFEWFGDINGILGYDQDEVIKTEEQWYDLIHPDYKSIIIEKFENLDYSQKVIYTEYRIRRKDGSYRYWVDRAKPLFDDNGNPIRLIGGCTDITERIETQKALEEKEELLTTVINATPDIMCFKGPRGEWLITNEANKSLFELDDVDVIGKTDLELAEFTSDYFSEVLKYCYITDEETWAKGGINRGEEDIYLPDGTITTFDLVKVPLHNSDGSRRGLVVLGRDISERKKSEIRIKQNEQNIITTLNSIGDGVITTDSQGIVKRINPVAEKLIGIDQHEAIDKNINDVLELFDIDTEDKYITLVKDIFDSEEEQKLTGIKVLKPQDEKSVSLTVNINGAVVKSVDDENIGTVIVFRDITNELLMQRQLHQSQKMDAIGQLAGGVAHDFNNMLSGIIGAAEMLSLDIPEKNTSKMYLKMIFNSAERAADLTSKLLAFSRKGKQQSSPVDIHNAIENVVAILERTINKNISITTELNAENTIIIGDPSLVENAILNLGINARDAMPDGGSIHIHTSNVEIDEFWSKNTGLEVQPGTYISMEFSDTGSGIPQKDIQKIFEPFFTTKEKSKGTGLGLASVYGTVKSHDGTISVYSEEGRGTIFHVYLPIKHDTARPQIPISEITIYGYGTVLVIDDEELIRDTAEALLLELGYDVILAENGEQGVEIYKSNVDIVDIVLLDMIMPGISGSETFDKLKEINPEVKIILSSGFTREEETSELLEKGLAAFIRKPYRRAVLSSVIHNIMNN